MSNWLNRLELKYGRYAIRGVTKYFVAAALIGYILQLYDSGMAQRTGIFITRFLDFNMDLILHGQVWRLVSWVFCAPDQGGILALIFLLCLWSMGNSLENIVGSFRVNVYLFGGVIISLAGGIIVYFLGALAGIRGANFPVLTTYYILLSIFMALALFMPDGQVLLYFIIPIRMKWILLLYFAELGYELFNYFRYGYSLMGMEGGLIALGKYGSQIVFALINLGLFFWSTRSHVSRKQKKRARRFYGQYDRRGPQFGPRGGFGPKPGGSRGANPGSNVSRHKCTICGRTEFDDPNLEFRYCSKCAGRHEYCQDHLFTHQHIRFQ